MQQLRQHVIRAAAGVALAVLVVGVAVLLNWSDQPEVRYSSLPCVYRGIYARSGAVSVVVVGTSRASWGISSTVLADEITPPSAAPRVVINLARSWRGTQQMLQQVRDLATERGIRQAIVVEYVREGEVGDTTQTYYDYLPMNAEAMPLRSFADDPQLKPREPAYLRLRDLLGQWQQRLDSALTAFGTGSWRHNRDVAMVPGTSEGCAGPDRTVEVDHLASYAKERMRRFGPWQQHVPVTWGMGAINADAQRVSIHQFVAFARAHDLDIYFVAMPRYLDPPVSRAFVDRFERRFGAPLLAPPPQVLARLYPNGFADPNHMRAPGRDRYSQWLGQQLNADESES